jgi:hypothetical protein
MKRDYILREIRRTAEANGGVPLGRLRFFNETGIKEYDWRGKFWARWNDAVREAGYVPNEAQGAYQDEFLLGEFVALSRELGHLPTDSEMRLKVRSNPRFPSTKSFRRFGSKAELVRQVAEYCRSRAGHLEVLAMCEQYAPRGPVALEDARIPAEEFGFVYLIKSGRFYKIGRSNAAGRREREIVLQLPEKASPVHVLRTDDPAGIEAYWHNRFREKRKNGEWFELDANEVAAFRRRKFM